jgi:tetratricopeptide (TPR) repeat protein
MDWIVPAPRQEPGGAIIGDSGPWTVPPPPVAPDNKSLAERNRIQQMLVQAGNAHRAGKIDRLTKILEEVLALDDKNSEALFNMAIITRDRNEISKAEQFFRRCLKANPEHLDAYQGLGDLLFGAKHTLSAIKIYEEGLAHAPNRLPLLANLLRARLMLRQAREVEAIATRILAIDDDTTDTRSYLAWAVLRQGRDLDRALAEAELAIRHKPGKLRALAVKQRILRELGRDAEASEIMQEVLTQMAQVTSPEAKAVAEMLLWTDDVPLAAQVMQEFLLRHPDDLEAETFLGQVAMMDGDFVAAQKIIDRLTKDNAKHPQLQLSSALNRFRLGEYAVGMRNMECRWDRGAGEAKWDLPAPDWDGKPILDGKLAIYAEQGVGDHVMYAGQMVAARERSKQIVFDTSDRLMSLFQRSFPDFEVVHRSKLPPGWPKHEVKARVAAADLAHVMGMDFHDLPGRAGFLIPAPGLLKKLRDQYQALFPGKLLIGISWRSGNRDSAALRSLELENWLPIFRTPGLAFVSLQYGDITSDIERIKEQFGIEIHWDQSINPMGNMDPFTAQVAAMDLVVSVDNSTVHFAGGLGKPSWCMLPVSSDWRWLERMTKPIWYDHLELLRQNKGDTWEEMVEKVAARLADVDKGWLAAAHNAMLKRCADTLRRYGRMPEMEEFSRLLLEAGAFKSTAFHGVGVAAMAVGRVQEAVPILAKALELSPDQAEYKADLAIALDAAGNTEQAERLARAATRKEKPGIEPLIAMGRILVNHNRFDEAMDYFARILREQPDHIGARVQLAKLQAALGEWELANENFRKTLQFAPSSASAHVGIAESALRLGDLETGWLHFPWRFATRPGVLPRHLETIDPKKHPKQWDGGHLRRQRVYLRAERSVEEQLLFAPILARAAGEARSTLAECPAELLTLLGTGYAKTSLVAAGSLTPEAMIAQRIQVATSLGDLATRFCSNPEFLDTTPIPLAIDRDLVETLHEEYRTCFPGRRLVGFAWRGGEGTPETRMEDWLDLFDADANGLVSLQRNATDLEMSEFAALGRDMIVDARGKASLDIFASQISALDVVVSADNLTALLAVRLGKKVVKLAGPADAWYWGTMGHTSPWLPSVSVQRQSAGEAGAAYAKRVAKVLANEFIADTANRTNPVPLEGKHR